MVLCGSCQGITLDTCSLVFIRAAMSRLNHSVPQGEGHMTISLICMSLLYNTILREQSDLTSRPLACIPTDVFSLE